MPLVTQKANPLAVLNVVGLSPSVLGEHTPNLNQYIEARQSRELVPHLPAVTTTSQSTMLTGSPPSDHGIVGNGWYDRAQCEVQFWKQSNRLVQHDKVWDEMRRRDPEATCLNMFWWYNMYSTADYSVTPRPRYKADGRKIPDCYSNPPDLRDHLQAKLGAFPLFKFWGAMAGFESSRWIAEATVEAYMHTEATLTLVYLPHLDYALQKFGPGSDEARRAAVEVDGLFGRLDMYFASCGVQTMLVSEYGISPVSRPVHINRVLREHGMLEVREEDGTELLDAGASRAFAVADHQVAHVYIKDPADLDLVARALEGVEGIEQVLDTGDMVAENVSHARSAELLCVANEDAWFTYYYWLDGERAPDFARCVDIHRKPGYDPAELFVDPAISWPKLKICTKLIRKKLGFRTLMDVIPLDASLVKGSHGRVDVAAGERPMKFATSLPETDDGRLEMTAVRAVMLDLMFGDS